MLPEPFLGLVEIICQPEFSEPFLILVKMLFINTCYQRTIPNFSGHVVVSAHVAKTISNFSADAAQQHMIPELP